MTMPPVPSWYAGRAAIGAFFATHVFGPGGIGKSRLAVYQWSDEESLYVPLGIMVFAIADRAIEAIHGFSDTGLFPFFHLPTALSR